MSCLALFACLLSIDKPGKLTPKEALQAAQVLVGDWKATGTPEGTREERQAGFWTETVQVAWKFTDQDVCLAFTHDKGKHFAKSELRYNVEKAIYELTVRTTQDVTQKYLGLLTLGKQKEPIFTLDRETDTETHRLVLTVLHANRYVMRSETRPKGGTSFTKRYQVGATKEGEPFAVLAKGNECVVSGGKGTIPVSHNGKTYYVCCSGCKDAFREDPEKWIAAAKKP